MDKAGAESDLAFIKQVMEESRSVLIDNGLLLIAWGALSIVFTVLTYGALYLRLVIAVPWIWVGFGLSGAAATLILGRKRRRQGTKTLAGKIYGLIWLGAVLFMAIVTGCLFLADKYTLALMLAVVAGGLGMAYFISSAISRNRFMFALSFVWWAGSFLIVLIGNFYAPLVLVGLVFLCEVVPGCILYGRYRRLHRNQSGEGRAGSGVI